MFQPEAFIPGSPAAGFDVGAWQQELDEQVIAQAIAELAKRGEIEDTVAFSELLLEKQNLAVAGLLDDQTDEYQIATDEQIALMEDALARHRANLDQMRLDPDLTEETAATEMAIQVLEGAIEQAYLDRATASAAFIQGEVSTTESAEQDKLAITKFGAGEQVKTIKMQEAAKSETVGAARDLEVEDHTDHIGRRAEREADGFEQEIRMLDRHFKEFLRYEKSFMDHDIDLLEWWLLQRQALITQAINQLPALPILPSSPSIPVLPEDPDSGGGGTASIQELQNLAVSLADEMGLGQTAIGDIYEMGYDELTGFIDWMQGQLGYYALGGGFGPGVAMVGEAGQAEIVRMGGAGRIDVFKDLLFRSVPPVGIGGTSSVDNSTNFGGFNIPDPRGLPPTYKQQVENMISNAVKTAWASK